jgi:heme oxygenase
MIHRLLKAETQHQYSQLEELMFTQQIIGGTLSLQQYKQITITNYLLVVNYEQAFIKGLSLDIAVRLELHMRIKLNALLKDLRELEIEISSLTALPNAVIDLDDDFIIGCLYILEGETLGGNQAYKMLKQNKQLSNFKLSFYYYQVYSEQLISYWVQLIDVLNSRPASSYLNILKGVKYMFNQYINLQIAQTQTH